MQRSVEPCNPLKQKLAAGKPVLGMWSIVPSAGLAEIFGLAGLDFLILDMEHGPYDLSSLAASVRACEGANYSPIVRVPGPNPYTIQSVMDLGIHGVIVPQVPDSATTREALRCMMFPPKGIRGYNPFTRAAEYAKPETNTVGKLNHAYPLKSIIIESKSAAEEIDEILGVEDLDMVYVGVYDLAVAMGHSGDTRHPEVSRFLELAVRKIRDAGKVAGMMVLSPADLGRAASMGGNFLVYSVDGYFIRQAAASLVESMNNQEY